MVMIGIDPHKRTHTAVAVDERETVIGERLVAARVDQVGELVAWADACSPATSERGRSSPPAGSATCWLNNSSPRENTSLMFRRRSRRGATVGDRPFRQERPERRSLGRDRGAARAGVDAGASRGPRDRAAPLGASPLSDRVGANKSVCRLHALVCELVAGGITKEVVVSQALALLENLDPAGAVGRERHRLALELVDDIARYDEQRKESNGRIRAAVAASGTTLTEIFGIGDVIAATLIGHTGDPFRFANEDKFAAYNGTAPVEWSSGNPKKPTHRLSRRGNRTMNHALHIAAVTQLRHAHSPGRGYYDRKRAEGHTTKTAIRALKRRISNLVYRHLIADAQRTSRRG